MRKRLFALVLVTIAVLTFAACGSTATVQDWVNSDEARQTEELSNSAFTSQGIPMSVKLNSDGNVLIFEYYIDDSFVSAVDTSALAASLASEGSVGDLFTQFEKQKIQLDAIRAVIYTSSGTKLESAEVTKADFGK